MMPEPTPIGTSRLFNSPLEIGLRTLFVLSEVGKPCDLQRLIIYDYFLLHSSDVSEDQISLHPPSPYRSSELLIKRPIIEKGLTLMMSKGLVAYAFSEGGIQFVRTEYASRFLEYFSSPYSKRVRELAMWVRINFQEIETTTLQKMVNGRIGRWGTEFVGETLVEEEPN
jgi:hypothetical protein